MHIKSEGFAKAVWEKRSIIGIKFKRKKFTMVKDGSWIYYDECRNIVSHCGFTDGRGWSGCEWKKYDKNGKVIGTYVIDY